MENTKIQALWNLCSELKLKRQQLLEQWKSTQGYLDYQQDLLEREFLALRDHNHGLAETLTTLHTDLQQLRSGWHEHISRSLALQQEFASLDVSYAELNSNFSSLQRELLGLHQELDQQTEQSQELMALQARFSDQQTELLAINQEYQQQREDLQSLLQEKTLQQGKVGELKQELQALRTRFSDVNGAIAQVFSDLSQYQKAWRQERESRIQAYDQLQSDYVQLEQDVAARQAEVVSLTAELAQAAAARDQLQQDLEAQAQTLNEVKAAHKATQAQAAVKASEFAHLQTLHQELETQLGQLKTDLTGLQAQLLEREQAAEAEQKRHHEELGELKRQLADAEAEVTAQTETKAALEVRLTEAESQSEALQTELQATLSQADALREQLTTAEAQADDLREQLASAQAQADDLREQLASAQAQAEALGEQLAMAQSQGSALEAQVEDLQLQIQTHTATIQTLENSLQAAESEVSQLKAQAEQQQSRYQALEESHQAILLEQTARYAALETQHQALTTAQAATEQSLMAQQAAHQQLEQAMAEAAAAHEAAAAAHQQAEAALKNELQSYAAQAARIPQAQTLITRQKARLAAIIAEREEHLPPLRAECAQLAAEQEQLAEQALSQHQAALQLQQQIQELQQEIARKDKLLAQLEGVEQSDAIRSARDGLTAEIRTAREQIVTLVEEGVTQDHKAEAAREQERASSLRFRQVQQSVALAEHELLTAQAHIQDLAQLDAILITDLAVADPETGAEVATLQARLGQMESGQSALLQELESLRQQGRTLAQELQQAQAEQQAKALQASQYQSEIELLRRKLLAKEHELQLQADRLSQQAFSAPEAAAAATPQAEAETHISEQVDQISSLLSELNLGFAGGLLEEEGEDEEAEEPEFEEEAPAKPRQRQILIYSDSVAEKEDWSEQLQAYLQEFSLGCQWVNAKSLPELASHAVKGLVFLVEPAQNPNPDLMRKLQQQGIPFVKHPISNVTRLKIDILDAFIR